MTARIRLARRQTAARWKVNPSTAGLSRAGEVIEASLGTYVCIPPPTGIEVQWYFDDEPLEGATGVEFLLTQGQRGKRPRFKVSITNALGTRHKFSPFADPVEVVEVEGIPSLQNLSAASVAAKTIRVELPSTATDGENLEIEADASFDFTTAVSTDYTLLQGDIGATFYDHVTAALPIGIKYFRAKVGDGDWSQSLAVTTVPKAPSVSVQSIETVVRPVMRVTFEDDAVEGMVVRLEYAAQSTGYGVLLGALTHTIDATSLANGYYDFTATEDLPEGNYIARANARLGLFTSDWSTTVQDTIDVPVVITGAPSFSNQTMYIGRSTRIVAGVAHGGQFLANVTGAVTGEGDGNALTGTGAANFEVLPNGMVRVVGTGTKGRNWLSAGYELQIRLSNSVGSTTRTLTIVCPDDEYDVRTRTEADSAIDAALAISPNNHYAIAIAPDARFGGFAEWQIQGKSFSGVFTDPNSGLDPILQEHLFNHNSVIGVSGGTMTIKCRTPKAAAIDCGLALVGSNGWIIDGLSFNKILLAEDGAYGGNDYAQLRVSTSTARPTLGDVWVKNCRFSGYDATTNARLWINAVYPQRGRTFICEDCELDGYFIGLNNAGFDHIVERRISGRRQILDMFPTRGTRATGPNPVTRHYYDCVIFDPFIDTVIIPETGKTFFAGLHRDSIQFGAHADVISYIIYMANLIGFKNNQGIFMDDFSSEWRLGANYTASMYCFHNGRRWDAIGGGPSSDPPVPHSVRGLASSEPGVGVDSATYWADTGAYAQSRVTVYGLIKNAFMMAYAVWGIIANNGTVKIKNCDVVYDTLRAPPPAGQPQVKAVYISAGGYGVKEIIGCIAGAFFDSGSTLIGQHTEENCAIALHNVPASDPRSYYSMYTGPIYEGPYGPTYDVDYTSTETIVQSIKSIFTPKPGGNGVNKGFTQGWTWL